MLCDDLEGHLEPQGLKREEMYVYKYLVHNVVQQKLIQCCKAIIFQFKKSHLKFSVCSSLGSR